MEGTKKKSIWKTLRGSLKPTPFLIVGILNVTPDSFYDGGKYFDPTQLWPGLEKFYLKGEI